MLYYVSAAMNRWHMVTSNGWHPYSAITSNGWHPYEGHPTGKFRNMTVVCFSFCLEHATNATNAQDFARELIETMISQVQQTSANCILTQVRRGNKSADLHGAPLTKSADLVFKSAQARSTTSIKLWEPHRFEGDDFSCARQRAAAAGTWGTWS